MLSLKDCFVPFVFVYAAEGLKCFFGMPRQHRIYFVFAVRNVFGNQIKIPAIFYFAGIFLLSDSAG